MTDDARLVHRIEGRWRNEPAFDRIDRVEHRTQPLAAVLVLLVVLLARKPRADDGLRTELLAAGERSERELRREISESASSGRKELTHTLATFQEALVKGYAVMDANAFGLCKENNLPIVVFNINQPGAIGRVLNGDRVGTIVR